MLVGLAAEIIQANRARKSWRERLGWIHQVLADERRTVALEGVVDLAVYLRFLATGEVPCAEDGHHYRPSHHANTSRGIFERLRAIATPENAFVLRKIYPHLPAFSAQFARKEPLTRIRDIAHRNDISQELKRELKHSLQNKLHRCAGPEDLATSAALLERFLADESRYPPAFIAEFKAFHAELREFFSARSLNEQLEALGERRAEGALRALARAVLDARADAADRRPPRFVAELRALTELREALARELSGGRASEETWQQDMLADISLEDRAFVVASELGNALLTEEPARVFRCGHEALPLLLRNLELSGVAPAECAAIAADVRFSGERFSGEARDDLLRLRALLQRCRRLAGDHTDAVLALFAERVALLGRALEVPPHAVETFCEADLRANLLFQLMRLVDDLDGRVRHAAGLSPWLPIVQGAVAGVLVVTESLGALVLPRTPGSYVVLARQAEGDENLPDEVVGLIVGHELPQLSHLAVRARQSGVVLAACESAEEVAAAARLAGHVVRLAVDENAASLSTTAEAERGAPAHITVTSPATSGHEDRADGASTSRSIVLKRREAPRREATIMPLGEAPADAVGAKASGLVKLAEVAAHTSACFSVPETLIVPLGACEAALQRNGALWRTYERLVSSADEVGREELPALSEQLRSLVKRVDVPPALVDAVVSHFAPGAPLMVRSSANCEDLDELAGAGLYDSIANVTPNRVAQAVRSVWASLWSERALLARRSDGISAPHAQMAVIVQRMIAPDMSFFMHTTHPLSGDRDHAYVELAAGLGETLASTTRGSPFRWTCPKAGGDVVVLAFPSLSEGLYPAASGALERRVLRYCEEVAVYRDPERRQALGARLGAIARELEQALGRAQDVEGVIDGDRVTLVQARAQQGLAELGTSRQRRPAGRRDAKQPQHAARAAAARASAQEETEETMGTVDRAEATAAAALEEGQEQAERAKHERERLAVLALVEKRIKGDDALLELASFRCAAARLGMEIHAATPEQLDHLLRFRPRSESPVVVHLPRGLDLLQTRDRDLIVALAAHAAGRVRGFVAHDQAALEESPEAYRHAVSDLSGRLARLRGKPLVFIEYAVGLAPGRFVEFFAQIASLEQVSACIDSGHVGIRELRHAFALEHPDLDPCGLTPYDERVPALLPALERARARCLPALLETIRGIARLEKPMHFHLHDGHPLWTLSPHGVSDHVSFFELVALPFEHEGRRTLELMYGPEGLRQIVQTAQESAGSASLSMTLEIHPVRGLAPLGEAAHLFRRWRNTSNAERMNFWLSVQLANARAVVAAASLAARRAAPAP